MPKYNEKVKELEAKRSKAWSKAMSVDVSGSKKIVGHVDVKDKHGYVIDLATGDIIETDYTNPAKAEQITYREEHKKITQELAKEKKKQRENYIREKANEDVEKIARKFQREAKAKERKAEQLAKAEQRAKLELAKVEKLKAEKAAKK